MFPAIHDIENLCVDLQLIPPKIFNTKSDIRKEKIEIIIQLEMNEITANVYLLVSGRKVDMFYSVGSGKYIFRDIHLQKQGQMAEFFYQIGGRKSPSAFIQLPGTL